MRTLRKTALQKLMLALCTLIPLVASATPGTLSRDQVLRAEARDDATIVLKLKKGAAVDVLLREGAWYRIEQNGQQGWIRLYWVRTGNAKVAAAGARPIRSMADTLAAARSRRNRTQISASIGVRGISEAELKGAHYDAAQMQKLDSYAVGTAAAARFAAAGPVQSRSVDELPAAGRSSRR